MMKQSKGSVSVTSAAKSGRRSVVSRESPSSYRLLDGFNPISLSVLAFAFLVMASGARADDTEYAHLLDRIATANVLNQELRFAEARTTLLGVRPELGTLLGESDSLVVSVDVSLCELEKIIDPKIDIFARLDELERRAEQLPREEDVNGALVKVLSNRAVHYRQEGRFDLAIRDAKRATWLARRSSHVSNATKLKAMFALMDFLRRSGDVEQAEHWANVLLKEASRLLVDSCDEFDQVLDVVMKVHLNLSSEYGELERYADKLRETNLLLNLPSAKSKDVALIQQQVCATICRSKAITLLEMGRLDEAMACVVDGAKYLPGKDNGVQIKARNLFMATFEATILRLNAAGGRSHGLVSDYVVNAVEDYVAANDGQIGCDQDAVRYCEFALACIYMEQENGAVKAAKHLHSFISYFEKSGKSDGKQLLAAKWRLQLCRGLSYSEADALSELRSFMVSEKAFLDEHPVFATEVYLGLGELLMRGGECLMARDAFHSGLSSCEKGRLARRHGLRARLLGGVAECHERLGEPLEAEEFRWFAWAAVPDDAMYSQLRERMRLAIRDAGERTTNSDAVNAASK